MCEVCRTGAEAFQALHALMTDVKAKAQDLPPKQQETLLAEYYDIIVRTIQADANELKRLIDFIDTP